MNQEQRAAEQREIKAFVQQAFSEVKRFTLEQFLEFNSQISSEMFVSVMSILQERLPCASFYFRQRRVFKHSLATENGDVTMNDGQFDVLSRGSRNSVRSKASQHIGGSSEMTSYVTAIAQPRIINAWSPSPTKRPSANRLSQCGSFREVRVDSSPDFRNTKGNGFQSPDLSKKLVPMNNGNAGSDRVNRALLSPPSRAGGQKALRMDSCSHFEESSLGGGAAAQMSPQTINRVNKSPQNGTFVANKMRKLNNARREWEQRHCSNSPFRIDNYGSSSSIGVDSMDGSPMAVNRGYGLRANIKGAAAADASQ